jgi:DNA-binding NtrC family response regulator
MAPSMQAKLLRVLQEREIERVGGSETLKIDVRVVAATNRDLRSDSAAGSFRADLFDRLNVVPVELPPLRARRGDIPELVEHFLALSRRENARPGITLDEGALAALSSHPFPGNVRELRNLVERLVILSPDDQVTRADVERSLGTAAPTKERGLYRDGVPFRVLSEDAERTIMEEALAAHGGQMAATARALGLERSHLYKKAKALGLRGDKDPEDEKS